MNKELVKLLVKTKNILEKKGWTQNACSRDKDGNARLSLYPKAYSYCLGGAITKAGCGILYNTIQDQLALTLKNNRFSIVGWNDAKGRTKKQVIALLDKTITRLSKA